jgi:choline kinase
MFVDFEYSSPNPAAFDIADHFISWTTTYVGSTPHLLDASLYPTHDERRNFLAAYLKNRIAPVDAPVDSPAPVFSELSPALRERELVALGNAVRAWTPSSYGMWAVWSVVQAREDVLARVAKPDFDYIAYARCRMAGFYRELAALGV